MDNITRICRKCGQEKPLSEFVRDKTCASGYRHTCKQCDREWRRKWDAENAERGGNVKRKWYAENAERGGNGIASGMLRIQKSAVNGIASGLSPIPKRCGNINASII